MIYTERTKRAMNIAYQAHHGQLDKGGMPYVFHPLHLAEQMDDEVSTVTALLHDVVEDAGVSVDELEEHIHAIEHVLYPDTIQLLAEGRASVGADGKVEVR